MCDTLIKEIRQEFPIFEYQSSQKTPFVYFDHAATALKPRCVIEAMTDYYSKYTANIHRGVHQGSYKASSEYEKARQKIARFINAKSDQEVIFTSGTTASINHFARSMCQGILQKGDRVILSTMEHHSSLVCWQAMAQEYDLQLDFIDFDDDGELDLSNLDALLAPPTKLLSVLSVSNTLGTVNPIRDLAKKCHAQGVYIFVDMAQSVAHLPTDVQADDIDFAAFSGHKIFGPTGIGVFWGKEELIKKLPPFFYGGGMIREVELNTCAFLEGVHRFEAGTPPIAEAIGLGAAIDFVQSLGWDTMNKITARNMRLADEIFSQYADYVILYGHSKHKIDIFSWNIPQIHAHDIGSFMAEMGIAIRSGHQCTQPITRHFHLSSLSRISSSVYNLCDDWQYFARKLDEMLRFFRVKQ